MDTSGLTRSTFTPPAPEDFFAAQRRHRRAARRLAVQAGVAAVAQSLLAAAMFSPFTVLVLVAGWDLVNVVHPVPDVFLELLDDDVPAATVVLAVTVVIGAGMVWLTLLWFLFARSIRAGLAGAVLEHGHRLPDHGNDEEHQLANVVEELAVAAGIRTPRVLLVPGEGANIAAFGRSRDDATLVVPAALLDRVDRRATTGLVADQIASIANGDLLVHRSVLALPLAWMVAQEATSHPFARTTWRMWAGLARLFRGRLDAQQESAFIAGLLSRGDADDYGHARGLRKVMQAIPVFCALSWACMRMLADHIVVGPLVSVFVRRRHHLADAMAVQLTRDAAGLAHGLVHLVDGGGALAGAEPAGIACIVRPATPQERRSRAAAEERARQGRTRRTTEELLDEIGDAAVTAVVSAANEQTANDPDASPDERAKARAALDVAGRRPVLRTGGRWHPATLRRLTRLEALGWTPADAERAWAASVLSHAEPGAWGAAQLGRRTRILLWAIASPFLFLFVLPFGVTVVAGLIVLSLVPIAVFYGWPMLLVTAMVHGLLLRLAG